MNDKTPDDVSLPGPDAWTVVEDRVIPIVEERVTVDKRDVERVAVRLRVRTKSEEVTISDPLRTERVEIERIPIDHIVSELPLSREENGVTVIPVFEEVLVRQFRLIEEIRVVTRVEMVEQHETVTLRRQEVDIEDVDSAASTLPEPPD